MAYDTNLIQKFVVHDGSEASDLMPMHIALVDEKGEPYGGAQGAQGPKGEKGVGVKSISLTVSGGTVTAGTWTDTANQPHEITISPAGE